MTTTLEPTGATPRIVIIGATSTIATRCARLWAAQGAPAFVLVGRDEAGLQRVAADLRARGDHDVRTVVATTFTDPEGIATLAADLCAPRAPDIVLIAHGLLPARPAIDTPLAQTAQALAINGTSAVLFAEAFANAMARTGTGTLAIIGSVAGERGRRSNYVYGAAKGLVARHAQGLQHRFAAGGGVRVVLIEPGPTDTPMTAAMRAQGARLADPDEVARCIVQGIDRGTPVVYAPPKWRWIMLVIRLLPRFVFNRMDI